MCPGCSISQSAHTGLTPVCALLYLFDKQKFVLLFLECFSYAHTSDNHKNQCRYQQEYIIE